MEEGRHCCQECKPQLDELRAENANLKEELDKVNAALKSMRQQQHPQVKKTIIDDGGGGGKQIHFTCPDFH